MTIAVANVFTANTFGHWVARTNELATAMSGSTVTVNSNTATGNAAISGVFTAGTLSANSITPSGANLSFNSGVYNLASNASLNTIGAVDIKGAIQFDSISNITILGSFANNPTTNFVTANTSTGVLYFSKILIPSSQLTDFGTANAVLSNTSIFQYNTSTALWGAGSIANIAFTSIANLQVGTLTSNLSVTGNTFLSNTLFVSNPASRVGINTIVPRVDLDVNGVIYATGDIRGFQTSDASFKTAVVPVNTRDELTRLMKVEVDHFLWLDGVVSPFKDPSKTGPDVGVIAQKFVNIYPDLVETRPDGTMAVNYAGLIPRLLASIQALNARIDELESR